MPNEPGIRPFHADFPEAELTELRRRINATRWPERETVTDDSQGVRLVIPFAISVFPEELYQAPRSWAERAYPKNLIHYNKLDRGGHFAAWEQPDLFCAEMRASFKTLR
jgi:pimeloyl-ACP methyl ester carboxylesterase